MEKNVSKLGGWNAWLIWFIANLIVVFGFNLQTGYAYVNGQMGEELNLTLSQIALAGSVYAWVFAISQFFSGSILDALGIRRVFPVSVSLVLVGAYLFANTTSLGSLIAAQVFLAVGASFGFVGAGFTGGIWFGFNKYGMMFGLTQTIASLGSFFGGILFTNLIDSGTRWNEVLDYMVYFGVVVLILTALFVRDPITSESNARKKIDLDFFKGVLVSMLFVLKSRTIIVSAITGGIAFGAYLAVGVIWGQKLYIAHGFKEIEAGTMASLIWVGLAIGSPFVNMLSDWLKSRRVVMFAFALIQAVSVLVLMFYSSSSVIVMGAVMLIYGFGGAGHMLAFTVGGESVDAKYVGTSAAIINGVMFICEGLIVALPGMFITGATLADLQSALISIPIVLVIGAFGVYLMKESYRAN